MMIADLREQIRLQKFYESLRVKDERPPYIFHGDLSRHEINKLPGNRKIKSVHILGLKTEFRPIFGASPAAYFVKNGGDDLLDGLSDANAWETLTKSRLGPYIAGDIIQHKRGDEWRGYWNSPSAGADGNPITLTAYGSGAAPIINNSTIILGWVVHAGNVWKANLAVEPGQVLMDRNKGIHESSILNIDAAYEWFWVANVLYIYSTADPDTAFTSPGVEASNKWADCVFLDENYVDVDGLHLECAHESGVSTDVGATGNAIKNTEINLTGFGVKIKGTSTLVDICNIHDLTMVVNTRGGADDYGGVGVQLSQGHNHEVRYTTFTDCIDFSWDFGEDGDSLEVVGNCDDWLFHHNWVEDCRGMLEFGIGTSDGGRMFYNVFIDSYRIMIHLAGGFGGTLTDCQVSNNTIVERNNRGAGSVIFRFNGAPDATMFKARNNSVYSNGNDDTQVGTTGYLHEYNCYYLYGGASLVVTLSTGEMENDPLFMDQANDDYRLQTASPCIEAGVDLGLTPDYVGTSVPRGSAPDIGAYEYQGGREGGGQFGDIRWPLRKRYNSGVRL